MVVLDPFQSKDCHLQEDHLLNDLAECRLRDRSLQTFDLSSKKIFLRPQMPSVPSILMFGHYEPLLQSRRSMLERCGLRVYTAVGCPEMRLLICRTRVDLIVLCHTVTLPECEYLLDLAKAEQPETATLLLRAADCNCDALDAESVFDIRNGPRSFTDCVRRMIGYATIESRRHPESRKGNAPGMEFRTSWAG